MDKQLTMSIDIQVKRTLKILLVVVTSPMTVPEGMLSLTRGASSVDEVSKNLTPVLRIKPPHPIKRGISLLRLFSTHFDDKNRIKREVRFSGNPVQTRCSDRLAGQTNVTSRLCDPRTPDADDPCCLRNCTLRPFAACSPINDICCTSDCQVAPPTQHCKLSSHLPYVHQFGLRDIYQSCVMAATFCDGRDSSICPTNSQTIVHAANFSLCGERSACLSGECLHYCGAVDLASSLAVTRLNLTLCKCRWESNSYEQDDKCKRCCDPENITDSSSSCVAVRGYHGSGSPCMYGVCPGLGCIRTSHHASPGGPSDDPDIALWATLFRWSYNIISFGLLLLIMFVFASVLCPICFPETKKDVIDTNSIKPTSEIVQYNAQPGFARMK